jgi:nucleoside-diphosphate-sugar epimerase
MKILLTGSNGFIGQYLQNRLSVDHTVICPLSKELDLTSRSKVNEFFKDQYFDVVIHAAVKGRNEVLHIDKRIVIDNVSMFTNLYENRECYKKFINLGSGAEFGLDQSINNAPEEQIFNRFPIESYGLAKNVIARIINITPDFFNLRIFSCFDPSESENRLLKKFRKSVDEKRVFIIDKDRYVDFVSLGDIYTVINAVLNNQIIDRDLNVVYPEKYKISDILKTYCEINAIEGSYFLVTGVDNKNYTGNGEKLTNYDLKLEGLTAALKKYNESLN